MASAFDGANHVLLVAPGGKPRLAELLDPAVDAAKAAGIEHLVFISSMGVDADDALPLRVMERRMSPAASPTRF